MKKLLLICSFLVPLCARAQSGTTYTFGNNIAGGNCPIVNNVQQVMSGVSSSGAPNCITPVNASSNTVYPLGLLYGGNSTNPPTVATGTQILSSLPSSGVSAGTYGSTTAIPQFTVDTYGRITSVTTQTVQTPPPMAITGATNTIPVLNGPNGSNGFMASSLTYSNANGIGTVTQQGTDVTNCAGQSFGNTCQTVGYETDYPGHYRSSSGSGGVTQYDNFSSIQRNTTYTNRTASISEVNLTTILKTGMGDMQNQDIEVTDRGGVINPSDEGEHAWGRFEHFEAQPFMAYLNANLTNSYTLPLIPSNNTQDLSAMLDIVDTTKAQTATVQSVSGQVATFTTNIFSSVSTFGTFTSAVVVPNGTSYDVGAVLTTPITYAGSSPKNLVCGVWGPGGQDEFIVVTNATAVSGGWSITATFRANHSAGDNIACGGPIHQAIRSEAMVVGTSHGGNVWYDDAVMAINSPNSATLADTVLGASNRTVIKPGAVTLYPAARVVRFTDSNNNYSPSSLTLDTPVSWSFNDFLEQPNYVTAAYVDFQGTVEIDNPYVLGDVGESNYNFMQIGFSGAGVKNGEIFNFIADPTTSGLVFSHLDGKGWGPAIVQYQDPQYSQAIGSRCQNVNTMICVEEPTGNSFYVYADIAADLGIDGIQVTPSTHTMAFTDSVQINTGKLILTDNAVASNGQDQISFSYSGNNSGLIGAAYSYAASGTPAFLGRFGYVEGTYGAASTSNGGKNAHPITNYQAVANTYMFQTEGNVFCIVGVDTAANPCGFALDATSKNLTLQGVLTSASLNLGTAASVTSATTEPTGPCLSVAWVLSDDGHGSYCPVGGGNWVQKF